jgi:hypothetical protein
MFSLRLLLPWHWLAVLTGAKSFRDNPVIGSARLNAAGLHVWRKSLAARLCERRRAAIGKNLPAHWLAQYQRQGMVRIDNFLEPQALAQLRTELATHALPMVEMAQAPALTRRANLDARSCAHMPATLALIQDPRFIGLLQYVAGYRGQPIIALQVVRSDADAPGAHDPQTDWHADTFHSTAKAWLFLHEVRADEGPLGYRPGSHAMSPQRLQWEAEQSIAAATHANGLHARGSWRADEATLTRLGYAQRFEAAVSANTLVMADTSGYHRRTPSLKPTVRLEVYMSLRRNPFFASLLPSLLGLPFIRSNWAQAYADLAQLLQPRGVPLWARAPQNGLREDERARLLG